MTRVSFTCRSRVSLPVKASLLKAAQLYGSPRQNAEMKVDIHCHILPKEWPDLKQVSTAALKLPEEQEGFSILSELILTILQTKSSFLLHRIIYILVTLFRKSWNQTALTIYLLLSHTVNFIRISD